MIFKKIKLGDLVRTFKKSESGASMVEYGVALLVVTGVGVATMTLLGTGTGNIVSTACGVIETEAGITCP